MTADQLHYTYEFFGLRVFSSLILPEVTSTLSEETRDADIVRVVEGRVPKELPHLRRLSSWMAVGNAICLYSFPGVGRLLIENGRTITFEIDPDGQYSDIRTYLLGSGFGTLLHQRKMVPLHISAIKSPKGIVAFTGPSGAGKSTIVSLLNKMTGWLLMTDDVAVMRPAEELPVLHAGITRLKLRRDAAELLNAPSESVSRDVARYDKFHVHTPEKFTKQSHRLTALFSLERGSDLALTEIHGAKRLESVLMSIYRPELISIFNDNPTIFKKCTLVSNQITFGKLVRPWNVEGLNSSLNLIAENFR